jgi:hypothetical protein
MNLTEIQNLLSQLMRGIDKKTFLTVEPSKDTNRSGVTVHLSRDKRRGALEFAESVLAAGKADLIGRNHLRSALKRARDRMWEESGYIFSTKMEKHKQEGNSWFRPSSSGRGRR